MAILRKRSKSRHAMLTKAHRNIALPFINHMGEKQVPGWENAVIHIGRNSSPLSDTAITFGMTPETAIESTA